MVVTLFCTKRQYAFFTFLLSPVRVRRSNKENFILEKTFFIQKKTALSLFTNISHSFFNYEITFVNSQHENTNAKGFLYLKTGFKRYF